MIKVLLNKKGTSLMEILVGSLMFALLAVTVSTVLTPMIMAMTRANDLAEYNTLLDNVANQITSDITQAIAPLELGQNTITIITNKGTLTYCLRNEKTNGGILQIIEGENPARDVFSPGFYKHKLISFSAEYDEEKQLYTLTVTVSPETATSPTFTRDYVVRQWSG